MDRARIKAPATPVEWVEMIAEELMEFARRSEQSADDHDRRAGEDESLERRDHQRAADRFRIYALAARRFQKAVYSLTEVEDIDEGRRKLRKLMG